MTAQPLTLLRRHAREHGLRLRTRQESYGTSVQLTYPDGTAVGDAFVGGLPETIEVYYKTLPLFALRAWLAEAEGTLYGAHRLRETAEHYQSNTEAL